MSAKLTARIRMYRLNELGDCFLISFLTAGKPVSHMLIDCGSFSNSGASIGRLKEIVGDIAKTIGDVPINVVVGTHQHNDHLSGFVHCEEQFRKIGVNQVWLSWLDNPNDRTARKIGNSHLELRKALANLSARAGKLPSNERALAAVNDMLGFYGAKKAGQAPELPAKAVDILQAIGEEKPSYLVPGHSLEMPGMTAGAVRIHVLGPPLSEKDLNRKDPRKGESYDHALAYANVAAAKLLNAVDGGKATSGQQENYPFGRAYQHRSKGSPELAEVIGHYKRKSNHWRNIDSDWLNQAEALALYMDKFTNNSSLVLAIELVASGKVLLFAADAQSGNWASWEDIVWKDAGVSTDSLLARTVLYKVGHHASHNATLVKAFEKMTDPNLAALIPVHKKDPNITKKGGWKMPARKLFEHVAAQTSNRVLQMDGEDPAACRFDKAPAKSAWAKIGVKPKRTSLYIELNIADE